MKDMNKKNISWFTRKFFFSYLIHNDDEVVYFFSLTSIIKIEIKNKSEIHYQPLMQALFMIMIVSRTYSISVKEML
jgi:hypothetical protein